MFILIYFITGFIWYKFSFAFRQWQTKLSGLPALFVEKVYLVIDIFYSPIFMLIFVLYSLWVGVLGLLKK